MKLDRDQAGTAIESQLCSNCWGELTEQFVEANVREVHCITEGCPCTGFVSRRYVERRMQEQINEMYEARHALADLIKEITSAGKPDPSHKDYLKMLGFSE